MDLKFVHGSRGPDAKVQALIVGGFVTSPAQNVCALPHSADGQIDRRSNRVPRTFRSADQLEPDPMIRVRVHVLKQERHVIQAVDYDVNLSVVE
jgi:hypothetical protein